MIAGTVLDQTDEHLEKIGAQATVNADEVTDGDIAVSDGLDNKDHLMVTGWLK